MVKENAQKNILIQAQPNNHRWVESHRNLWLYLFYSLFIKLFEMKLNQLQSILSIGGAILTATISLNAAEQRHGVEAAKKQAKLLIPHPELEATLFASEPMFVNPANMDIDAEGRVWVTEGVNYRQFKPWGRIQPKGDRIRILEDTDGDGKADVAKTFYQGNDVNAALGICVLGTKIIVSCSPKILLFTDENGDDKADGPPKILFNGIGGVDHDHGAHAFVFGPDGKLYFNIGNDGRRLKTPDGKNFIVDKAGNEVDGRGKPYRQGLVFRCNLDTSEVETLGFNFRNNYEVTVDSFGTIWQSDNDDDGNRGVRINYVMEFGNYGYTDELTGRGWRTKRTNQEEDIPSRHWHQNDPGVIPNLLQTGQGSPTGIAIYEGKLLPNIFQGQIMHCDAGPRIVRAYPVKRSGAGYTGETVNMLQSKDPWYRPSDVCTAPDGSVFISDWHDGHVGGHHMTDHKPGQMTGRIYRLTPKGKSKDYKIAKNRTASSMLSSPNMSERYIAWQQFHKVGLEAEETLLKMWESDDQRIRARAIHLLARIDGSEKKYINKALSDNNPDIRITGIRIARERGLDMIPFVRKMVNDKDSGVRRECAIALRHNNSPQAPGLWAQLAKQHNGQDRWYLEALGLALDKQQDKFFEAWLDAVGSNWDTPGGRDIIWRSRSSKTSNLLVEILLNKKTKEAEKSRYIRALDFQSGPEKEAALIKLIGAGS